jgi:hypothetical protein
MKTISKKLEKYALPKELMSKIKGGEGHYEYIDGKWVWVNRIIE